MTTTVAIPPELWQIIAFYLTDDELWALRDKNGVLRELAWDPQCRSIRFPFEPKSMLERDLQHLQKPFIADRVREIVLSDDPLSGSLLDRIVESRTRASALSKRIDALLRESDPFKRLYPSFGHISSIQVHWPMMTSDRMTGAYSKRALLTVQAYSETLRSLTVNLEPNLIAEFFESILLPHLASLTLLFHEQLEFSMLSDSMDTTILPFLARHNKTLKSFHIPKGDMAHLCYPGSIKMESDSIPHFEFLTIGLWYVPNGIHQGVLDFIASQSRSLKSLTLVACTASYFIPPEVAEAPLIHPDFNLPNLTHLVVEHSRSKAPLREDDSARFFRVAIGLAEACSKTLLSLEIRGERLEVHADRATLPWTMWERLKVLTLCIYQLRALDLDFLGCIELFPQLEELALSEIRKFGASMYSTFEVDLSLRKYDQSKIRYLYARTYLEGSMAEFKALVKAFPGLLLFNDVPRYQFLEIPDDQSSVPI